MSSPSTMPSSVSPLASRSSSTRASASSWPRWRSTSMPPGCSPGGRADCLALARAGADVVVTDILIESDPELEKVAEASGSALSQLMASQKAVYSEKTSNEIREMGRRSVALKMDVTNREQVKEVVDQVVKDFGSLDILINNAGTLDHMATVDSQVDALWDRDLKVNLTGAFNCSKAVWPHMKARN